MKELLQVNGQASCSVTSWMPALLRRALRRVLRQRCALPPCATRWRRSRWPRGPLAGSCCRRCDGGRRGERAAVAAVLRPRGGRPRGLRTPFTSSSTVRCGSRDSAAAARTTPGGSRGRTCSRRSGPVRLGGRRRQLEQPGPPARAPALALVASHGWRADRDPRTRGVRGADGRCENRPLRDRHWRIVAGGSSLEAGPSGQPDYAVIRSLSTVDDAGALQDRRPQTGGSVSDQFPSRLEGLGRRSSASRCAPSRRSD